MVKDRAQDQDGSDKAVLNPNFKPELIQEGVRLILEGIGEDGGREGLKDTPARVSRAFQELCLGMYQDPKEVFTVSFQTDAKDLVSVKDIPFHSLCEHHLLPFFGTCDIVYLPGGSGRVCGISKLARAVDICSHRLQLQERLCDQVAQAVLEGTGARGVLVYMEAEHMCMSMRGVRKPGSKTATRALRGVFADDTRLRREAMELIRRA